MTMNDLVIITISLWSIINRSFSLLAFKGVHCSTCPRIPLYGREVPYPTSEENDEKLSYKDDEY